MGELKYYEEEVLSVSAGKTIEFIDKYKIHACPYDNAHRYKKFIFITFRRSKDEKNGYEGGEMEVLYKALDDTLILNPYNQGYEDIIRKKYSTISPEYVNRLINYINNRMNAHEFEKNMDFKFYILSETDYIRLNNKPIPINGNNSYKVYYDLSELLSGKKRVKSNSKAWI